MRNRFKIKQEDWKTAIFVGEKQIERVRSYQLSQSAGEIPILTLEIMPDIKQIELEGQVIYRYYDINGDELVPKE